MNRAIPPAIVAAAAAAAALCTEQALRYSRWPRRQLLSFFSLPSLSTLTTEFRASPLPTTNTHTPTAQFLSLSFRPLALARPGSLHSSTSFTDDHFSNHSAHHWIDVHSFPFPPIKLNPRVLDRSLILLVVRSTCVDLDDPLDSPLHGGKGHSLDLLNTYRRFFFIPLSLSHEYYPSCAPPFRSGYHVAVGQPEERVRLEERRTSLPSPRRGERERAPV